MRGGVGWGAGYAGIFYNDAGGANVNYTIVSCAPVFMFNAEQGILPGQTRIALCAFCRNKGRRAYVVLGAYFIGLCFAEREWDGLKLQCAFKEKLIIYVIPNSY